MDRRQKKRFGAVGSWVITTEKVDGVVNSGKIQSKMWREDGRGPREDPCRERRHAVAVRRSKKDRAKRKKNFCLLLRVCLHMCACRKEGKLRKKRKL